MLGTLHLPPQVMYALIGAFALLIIASIIAMLLARVNPQRDYTELRLRLKT